jgi:hypothetical protein
MAIWHIWSSYLKFKKTSLKIKLKNACSWLCCSIQIFLMLQPNNPKKFISKDVIFNKSIFNISHIQNHQVWNETTIIPCRHVITFGPFKVVPLNQITAKKPSFNLQVLILMMEALNNKFKILQMLISHHLFRFSIVQEGQLSIHEIMSDLCNSKDQKVMWKQFICHIGTKPRS